jgi:hypothetical protein
MQSIMRRLSSNARKLGKLEGKLSSDHDELRRVDKKVIVADEMWNQSYYQTRPPHTCHFIFSLGGASPISMT